MEYIKTKITVGISLLEIRQMCEEKLLELGADSFWYWDIGAFVFSGDETTISISGTKYKTSDKLIRVNDIITIDLSPQCQNIWGDFARTIVLENGNIVESIDHIKTEEWKNGLFMEEMLHKELLCYVTKQTTFEELYYHMNKVISDKGYKNIDFMGNLGHSIVVCKDDRIYIEKGNAKKLSEVSMFTFEPHISRPKSLYGYKREDIYYFKNRSLNKL